jgi:hypothetical protein
MGSASRALSFIGSGAGEERKSAGVNGSQRSCYSGERRRGGRLCSWEGEQVFTVLLHSARREGVLEAMRGRRMDESRRDATIRRLIQRRREQGGAASGP